MMNVQNVYLGDGVYAMHEGSAVILTTESGRDATNHVDLEAAAYTALVAFLYGLLKAKESGR
jgi:hypothetical protein